MFKDVILFKRKDFFQNSRRMRLSMRTTLFNATHFKAVRPLTVFGTTLALASMLLVLPQSNARAAGFAGSQAVMDSDATSPIVQVRGGKKGAAIAGAVIGLGLLGAAAAAASQNERESRATYYDDPYTGQQQYRRNRSVQQYDEYNGYEDRRSQRRYRQEYAPSRYESYSYGSPQAYSPGFNGYDEEEPVVYVKRRYRHYPNYQNGFDPGR
jgi:hypothetical protein